MNNVKNLSKNWLSLKIRFFLLVIILFPFSHSSQIANYVRNGGFEDRYGCSLPNELNQAKGWNCIGSDTSKFGSFLYSVTCYSNAPLESGISFQYAHGGNSFYRMTAYCANPCMLHNSRYYPKNRLKGTLVSGKIYCVKMYVNLQNTSPFAIKNLGIYFGNNTIDTINYANSPLTYITPQITNVANIYYSDTLNWVPFTGTFTANGTEKYLVIGDFTSDAAQTKTLVLPSSMEDWAEYMIDDVSCIDVDLPAYAGPDVFCIPGNSVYIGRPQDVGIDEACMWYKLPNMTNAIDTAAGTWVSPVSNSTYVVKQDICGVIKYDTVVVVMSGVGIRPFDYAQGDRLKIYPVPANNELNIYFTIDVADRFKTLSIFNSLGQLLREEEIKFVNQTAIVKTENLTNGVYFFSLTDQQGFSINKRFLITR